MTPQEKFFKNFSLASCFHYLTDNELEILSQKKTELLYEKGENLLKEGAFASHVMYVIEGLTKVYIQAGPRKHVNLSIARQGDFLGFSSIFGKEAYSYSCLALKDTRVCMFNKEALRQVLIKNPTFAMMITSRNYRIENQLLEIIKNISYKQMRGKLASALCYLSSDEFLAEGVFLSLTRQDIADFAGITQESTVKFLKEFEREGWLELQKKDILIQDKNKLQLISKSG